MQVDRDTLAVDMSLECCEVYAQTIRYLSQPAREVIRYTLNRGDEV